MTYYNNIRVVKMLNGYKQNLNRIGFKIKIIDINKHIDRNNIWYFNYYHRLNNNVLFNLCYYLLYQYPSNKYFVAIFIHYNDGSFCIDRLNTFKSPQN